ncbi:ribonuclease T2 family protein [Alteripontixanthobacter maritimus]|nr:ribonuclease T [Alteripontixanthobacter maritimus]
MTRPRAFLPVAVTAVIAAFPAPAIAQAHQCRAAQRVSVPTVRVDGPRRTMPTTGYTLALSWSPEFCKSREGQARHAAQCSGKNGRFGLIVHGLWPQGRGGWPQWCPTRSRVSPAEAARNMCMMPGARLQARQWVKHGSCMTRRPRTYFKVTRILWNSLRIPELDRLSRQEGLSAGDIRTAFASANKGWPARAIGIKLNGRGWLQELRLCYSRRFRPEPCDARRLGPADRAKVKIWRGM